MHLAVLLQSLVLLILEVCAMTFRYIEQTAITKILCPNYATFGPTVRYNRQGH